MEANQPKFFQYGFRALGMLVFINWLFQFGQFEHPNILTYAILILPFSAWLILTTLIIMNALDNGAHSGEVWVGMAVLLGIFWVLAHLVTWCFPAEHIFAWKEINHTYTGFFLYKILRFGGEMIKAYYNYVGWINFLGSLGIGIWLNKYIHS